MISDLGSGTPDAVIVLGSGMGDLCQLLHNGQSIPYGELPGFPVSTAPSHAGLLHRGELDGHPVVILQGRHHLYEGYDPYTVTIPIRAMAALGIKNLILTNAAGAIHPDFQVGDLVLIKDHLSFPSLTGLDPMRGPADSQFSDRFTTMNGAYDGSLRSRCLELLTEAGLPARTGVYGYVAGPTFETPSEIRMLETLGVDMVGMSTVPEVVVAKAAGMSVTAISGITNRCIKEIDSTEQTSIDEVWASMDLIKPKLATVLTQVARLLPEA